LPMVQRPVRRQPVPVADAVPRLSVGDPFADLRRHHLAVADADHLPLRVGLLRRRPGRLAPARARPCAARPPRPAQDRLVVVHGYPHCWSWRAPWAARMCRTPVGSARPRASFVGPDRRRLQMAYVDGFIVAVPRANIEAYK